MKAQRLLAAATLLLALASAPARSQDNDTTAGKIEAVDRDGRIRVNGRPFVVDRDSDIIDSAKRPVKPRELVVGVYVELAYESSSRGDHATRVIANLVR